MVPDRGYGRRRGMSVLWLDEYERRARLVPGLLALFPVVVLVAVLGLRQVTAISAVLSALTVVGGPVLVAGTVRNLGRSVETDLWANWGGPPSTVWLRLREPTDNEVQRDLWRKAVEAVSGVSLLSSRAERSNPTKADDAITLAVRRIRDRARDKEKFGLLFSENRDYGYERNLYGVRWAGRVISLASVIAMVSYMSWVAPSVHRQQISAENLFGLVSCLLCFVGWCLLPSKKRVREAADRYANELLHAAVTLQEESEDSARNTGDTS
jgi:hypothetical protein